MRNDAIGIHSDGVMGIGYQVCSIDIGMKKYWRL
jgi:hypothetical protein